MTSALVVLERLAVGAGLAWLALPLLMRALGNAGGTEPQSRHAALSWPLPLASTLFAVPWLHGVLGSSEVVEAPSGLVIPEPTGALVAGTPWWSLLAALGAVWCATALVGTVRALRSLAALRAMLRSAQRADAPLEKMVGEAAAPCGVVRTPTVLVSAEATVPFVAGLRRPRLVLPWRLVSSLREPQLLLIVQHELTHVARGDVWAGALQMLLAIGFTGHPSRSKLERELVVAREEAVDATVEPAHRREYAQLLVAVAEVGRLAAPAGVAASVAMSADALHRRIETLGQRPRRLAKAAGALAVGVLLFSCGLLAPRVVSAAEQKTLQLKVATPTTLAVAGVNRLAMSDPQVCDVTADANGKVTLVGVHPGSAKLVVWSQSGGRLDYDIEVTK